MSDANGAAKTLPVALMAEFAKLEETSQRVDRHAAQLKKLEPLPDLVLRLMTKVDLAREAHELTLVKLEALTSSVDALNTGVLQLIAITLGEAPQPRVAPEAPTAKTHLSLRRRKP